MNRTADTSKLCGCKFNRNVTRLAYVVEMSSNTQSGLPSPDRFETRLCSGLMNRATVRIYNF